MADGINRIMNFLKLTDEDDEFDDDIYDDEYDYADQKELEKEEKRYLKEKRKEERRNGGMARKEESYYEPERVSAPKKTSFHATSANKVVQMPASSGTDMEVCIVKPANVGEAQQVCSLLMENHPVVVNLEGIALMEAQRIMDFIAGCIYAVNGNMCQVSRYIFIFSPQDIDISGDYLKSLETEESYNIAAFNQEF